MNDQLEETEAVATLEPSPRTKPQPPHALTPVARAVAPKAPPRAPVRTAFDDNEELDDTFIGRHGGKLAIVVLLSVAGAVAYFVTKEKSAPVRKAPERLVTIQIPPPPPAPPPPPPPPKIQPPPPPEEKMTEVTPVEEEPKPESKPADEPPAGLDTNIKGDGAPGGMTLPGGNGGRGGMIGGSNGGARGNPHGYYFGQVQKRIADALNQNKKTRTSRFSALQVRIWPDATGRITRAQLVGSTGDAAVDAAIRDEVLNGLQLHEALPQGVKPPVVLRVNARRSN